MESMNIFIKAEASYYIIKKGIFLIFTSISIIYANTKAE